MKPGRRHLLVLLTPLTYLVSYLYLAWYHNELNLWGTVIHESGKLTFYQTTFYSSHFLGHILVYVIVSLLFVGYYLSMSSDLSRHFGKWKRYALVTAGILVLALIHSLLEFGPESTWDYLMQRMQDENNRYPGNGSWNLHFVSTTTLIFAIPFYIAVCLTWMRSKVTFNWKGISLVGAAVCLIVLVTVIVNGNLFSIVRDLWTDDRHLAHSAREMVTFGLIYFPLALFMIQQSEGSSNVRPNLVVLLITFLIALGPVFIQILSPLQAGIDNLSQTPSFAREGKLSIIYLLASHFFEHFIDSLFFVSLCLFWFHVSKRTTA